MRSDLRRLGAAVMGALLATTMLVVPVAAQDATGSPPPGTCDVLTSDEVSAALGDTLTVATGSAGSGCEFDADFASGHFLSLFTAFAPDTSVSDLVGFMCATPASPAPAGSAAPCSVDLTVAGNGAVYFPEGFGGHMLYVQTGSDAFDLQLVGDAAAGIDTQAALTSLAELAVPRLASVPRPTDQPSEPQPSFHGDTDLEALFPTQIGNVTLEVQSLTGEDITAQGGDIPQEFLDALAAQGKSMSDVSFAIGGGLDAASGSTISITAIQIDGVDIAPLADDLIAVLGDQAPASQTPGEVGGKTVTVVKPQADSADSDLQYVYPKGDILWIVSAVDPALTEVFQKLP